jgi:hypothetical protein
MERDDDVINSTTIAHASWPASKNGGWSNFRPGLPHDVQVGRGASLVGHDTRRWRHVRPFDPTTVRRAATFPILDRSYPLDNADRAINFLRVGLLAVKRARCRVLCDGRRDANARDPDSRFRKRTIGFVRF